jgi:hypothetical protein
VTAVPSNWRWEVCWGSSSWHPKNDDQEKSAVRDPHRANSGG